ncbi:MAG: hypothetical protein ABEI76_11365 [Halobacteriales archaeon]
MELFRWESKRHGTVVLTAERWNHIRNRHPGLTEPRQRIRQTVQQPDIIERSLTDADTCLYYKSVDGKYMVVAVQVDEQFIKTAYQTAERKGGEIIWANR